ncbi:MAG TPA: alpha/beta hydrolase [Casimicrobiaceae bacterium]|nr:alpha/beta hydrolase [Casimicrobiaceae bacterium]
MNSPREYAFLSLSAHGFHRVVYREWGDTGNPRVLVCVHGLTRNGRDFDALAAALADRFRVLCPDMPGRGDSEWLRDPNDYAFPTYLTALTAMLAHAHAEKVAWVGTSMGGLLGMTIAAQPQTPIVRLVMNDIGPAIEPAALARIATYVGLAPVFDSFAALEAHIREVSAPFGRLTDAQWETLARTSARQLPDGRWRLKYDPGIAVPFRGASSQPADLWPLWDAIRCPTLLLRGAQSDLLSAATAAAMRTRGPRPEMIEFADVGHAPMLLTPQQIAPVADFLAAE